VLISGARDLTAIVLIVGLPAAAAAIAGEPASPTAAPAAEANAADGGSDEACDHAEVPKTHGDLAATATRTACFLRMKPGNLYGAELYYNLAITRWLLLTADLQIAQGVNKRNDIAVIPGARLVLDF